MLHNIQNFAKSLTFSCFLLLIFTTFYGCSWREHFIIINETDKEVVLSYELTQLDNKNTFPIFQFQPLLGKLTSQNNIDWASEIPIIDADTTLLGISVKLPPKSSLKIGSLSNDRYKTYNQVFINGRVFNLKNIIFYTNEHETKITPETFDNFFKKASDGIIFRIK